MPRLLSNLLQTTPVCFITAPGPCGGVCGEIGPPDQFLIPRTPSDTENGPPDHFPGVSNPTSLLSAAGLGG